MKNTAVEALIRIQHNIPPNVEVHAEFIAVINGEYEFKVRWNMEDKSIVSLNEESVFIKSEHKVQSVQN